MYDEMSFVLRGKVRLQILKELQKPFTPSALAEKISTHRSTVSRTLLSMKKEGLVTCVTPDEKMGRLYLITDTGKKVLKEIEK